MSKIIVDGIERDMTPEEEASLAVRRAAGAEEMIRRLKVAEIKVEGLFRISGDLPEIDTMDELEDLVKIAPAIQLSVKGEAAKATYVYARNKIVQAQTADIALVQAYDPTTDPGWPS